MEIETRCGADAEYLVMIPQNPVVANAAGDHNDLAQDESGSGQGWVKLCKLARWWLSGLWWSDGWQLGGAIMQVCSRWNQQLSRAAAVSGSPMLVPDPSRQARVEIHALHSGFRITFDLRGLSLGLGTCLRRVERATRSSNLSDRKRENAEMGREQGPIPRILHQPLITMAGGRRARS